MRNAGWFVRLRARLRDERGLTLVEVMVAGMILSVGAFAVAQALNTGLKTSGLSRQRFAAKSLADQQMELARNLNYENVILLQELANPITHSTDPDNPDYWVDEGPPLTYDPDDDGPLGFESLVVEDANPYLLHYQTDVQQGNTSYTVYTFVTWVDSPLDGTGGADAADGNEDGVDDSNGQDQKRVTIVVSWDSISNGVASSLTMGSLFSDGKVPYHADGGAAVNQPPTVICPLTSNADKTANFTAQATDVDGTISQVDWDFDGDGTYEVTNGGGNQSHTYNPAGTYTVVNRVFDDDGASATNTALNCEVTVTNPEPPDPDNTAPTGSIVINSGSGYTTQLQVTLTLDATDEPGGSGVSKMQFSTDGVTYGAAQDYATSAIYTLDSGDGTKTVYVKFIDAAGNVSSAYSDNIVLDTGLPGAPSGLTASRAANKKSAVLQWSAPAPLPGDLAGYQVWRRPTTSSTWSQITCNYIYGVPTKCQDPSMDNLTNYEYYVVSVDNAGNQSAESNHVTV